MRTTRVVLLMLVGLVASLTGAPDAGAHPTHVHPTHFHPAATASPTALDSETTSLSQPSPAGLGSGCSLVGIGDAALVAEVGGLATVRRGRPASARPCLDIVQGPPNPPPIAQRGLQTD